MRKCAAGAVGLQEPLTQIEMRVFVARFLEGLTLDAAATKVGHTRERVRQIELRAAAKVRQTLCARQFREAQ